MKPENDILQIDVQHRVDNKILYQIHFLVFDYLEFRHGISGMPGIPSFSDC
jgi:hypothetical protein